MVTLLTDVAVVSRPAENFTNLLSCLMTTLQNCDGNREERRKPRAVRLLSVLCFDALSSGVDYQ